MRDKAIRATILARFEECCAERVLAILKDVFIWAYERSAASYAAVRQSAGEPDPFRLRHRDALREVVAEIVRGGMGECASYGYIASQAETRVGQADREEFRDLAERELLGLHEGNFARHGITPAEFEAWRRCRIASPR